MIGRCDVPYGESRYCKILYKIRWAIFNGPQEAVHNTVPATFSMWKACQPSCLWPLCHLVINNETMSWPELQEYPTIPCLCLFLTEHPYLDGILKVISLTLSTVCLGIKSPIRTVSLWEYSVISFDKWVYGDVYLPHLPPPPLFHHLMSKVTRYIRWKIACVSISLICLLPPLFHHFMSSVSRYIWWKIPYDNVEGAGNCYLEAHPHVMCLLPAQHTDP